MVEEPAGTPVTEEEDKKRRRAFLWLLFLGIGLIIIVVVFIVLSGDETEPQAVSTSTQTAQVSSTTSSAAATTTTTVAAATNTTTTTLARTVSGVWSMIVDVTVATGACRGEEGNEDDEIEPDTVTIVQDGDSITLVGLGHPKDTQVWKGSIDGDTVSFNGTRQEDQGLTTAAFTLTVNFEAGTMTGIELWTWEGPGGTCPGSESVVTASLAGS